MTNFITISIIIIIIILIIFKVIFKIVQANNSKAWKYSYNKNVCRKAKKRKKKIVKKTSNDEIIQLIENYEKNKNTQ